MLAALSITPQRTDPSWRRAGSTLRHGATMGTRSGRPWAASPPLWREIPGTAPIDFRARLGADPSRKETAARRRIVEFQLLGPVQACHEGTTIPLGRRRERCLLAILLLEAGSVVPVDRLIDLLWDGVPSPAAR